MKLKNTKRYYLDLAHYYFNMGRLQLAGYFRGLANSPESEFNKEDQADMFWYNNIPRPERDADGNYI